MHQAYMLALPVCMCAYLAQITPPDFFKACTAPVGLSIDHVDIQLPRVAPTITPHLSPCSTNQPQHNEGDTHQHTARDMQLLAHTHGAKLCGWAPLYQAAVNQKVCVCCRQQPHRKTLASATAHLPPPSICCCSEATWPPHPLASPAVSHASANSRFVTCAMHAQNLGTSRQEAGRKHPIQPLQTQLLHCMVTC